MEIARKSNFCRLSDFEAINLLYFLTLDGFARSGVRRFHTIDALCAIEFFMKYVLKCGPDLVLSL